MKLVSVTIANNREDVIGDMVRSVAPLVDEVIILDTGITDNTLKVARKVCAEAWQSRPGGRMRVKKFPWVNDFSAARNAALGAASSVGADWALMVDTDEVLHLVPPRSEARYVRNTLEAFDVSIPHLFIRERDGTYMQPRFFRLPAKGKFSGPTHEAYGPSDPHTVLDGVTFSGKTKTAEQMREKLERDLAILEQHTEENPTAPRWWYYLGATYSSLGMHLDAIQAFSQCSALKGWDEESAVACFRAGVCWMELGQPDRAVEVCAEGLARHAGCGELAWLAADASYRLKKYAQAIYWAEIAIQLGCYSGIGATVPRISFRSLVGLYDGPYDVLRWAYKQLGRHREQEKAEISYQIAKRCREQVTSGSK